MTTTVVFLDLSEMDDTLLRYVAQMDELLKLEEIYLVHYLELQDTTEDYASHFPELERPLEDVIYDEIHERALNAGLNESHFQIKVHGRGGQEDLLGWINHNQFGLCVFGKKVVHHGTGVFAGKVARLINKSILFVTETARHRLDKMLVPIDFSSYSRETLKFANRLVERTESELLVLHVYHIPPIYFPFVKEKTKKLEEEVRKKAERSLKQFCEKYSTCESIQPHLAPAGEQTTAKTIYDFARREHTDLIVLGIKGKTSDQGLLIGSVAERLIQSDRDIPVLIVKS